MCQKKLHCSTLCDGHYYATNIPDSLNNSCRRGPTDCLICWLHTALYGAVAANTAAYLWNSVSSARNTLGALTRKLVQRTTTRQDTARMIRERGRIIKAMETLLKQQNLKVGEVKLLGEGYPALKARAHWIQSSRQVCSMYFICICPKKKKNIYILQSSVHKGEFVLYFYPFPDFTTVRKFLLPFADICSVWIVPILFEAIRFWAVYKPVHDTLSTCTWTTKLPKGDKK